MAARSTPRGRGMTAAQSFIRADRLNDAQRVARLRAAAVLEEERICRTVWTMPDGSRAKPLDAKWLRRWRPSADAYGTLPSAAGSDRGAAAHQGRPADRGILPNDAQLRGAARCRAYGPAARGTGMESWARAARDAHHQGRAVATASLARFRLEACRHPPASAPTRACELIRIRRGTRSFREYRLDRYLHRGAA